MSSSLYNEAKIGKNIPDFIITSKEHKLLTKIEKKDITRQESKLELFKTEYIG